MKTMSVQVVYRCCSYSALQAVVSQQAQHSYRACAIVVCLAGIIRHLKASFNMHLLAF